jgi:hypothetical protein
MKTIFRIGDYIVVVDRDKKKVELRARSASGKHIVVASGDVMIVDDGMPIYYEQAPDVKLNDCFNVEGGEWV